MMTDDLLYCEGVEKGCTTEDCPHFEGHKRGPDCDPMCCSNFSEGGVLTCKKTVPSSIPILQAALDKLVHACEDEVDDYNVMVDACREAKRLLPDYKE